MSSRARTAAIVCVGVFVASLDLFIVNIAFPDMRADFGGTSLASLSWVLNAYAIVFAALLVPAGRWADRAGRKRAFLGGLAIFTAASAACAAAPSAGFLIGARAVQAVGAAALMPTSLALLLPEFPPDRRQVAVGIWAAVGGAAAAAGPLVGGLLVQASWRWVFLVNVPVGLTALVAGVRVLRETRDPSGPRPDYAGAGLLAAGVGALALGIVKAPGWGWGSPRVVALYAAAAALVALVAVRCVRHPAPVVEPALLRVRAFALANVATLLFFAAFGAMLLSSVLFLTTVWHEEILTAGLMLAPGPALAATCAVPGALLGERIGAPAVGALGALLFVGAGVWWLTHDTATPHYATAFLPGMIVGGMGVGLMIPSAQGAGTATLPPQRFATGIAVLSMSRQIGAVLGIAILVAILGTRAPGDPLRGFEHAWGFMVGAAAAASLAMLAIGSPAARRAPRAEPAEAGA